MHHLFQRFINCRYFSFTLAFINMTTYRITISHFAFDWQHLLIQVKPFHVPGNTAQSRICLHESSFCGFLLLHSQSRNMGELNVANRKPLQQARQPLQPGGRELALGEEKSAQTAVRKRKEV